MAIGHCHTISRRYIVALMTRLLRLEGGEKILEIETGLGYQTGC
jgi:protein-L-isoaspartate(D-aspartate) O-methyltransferase